MVNDDVIALLTKQVTALVSEVRLIREWLDRKEATDGPGTGTKRKVPSEKA